MRKNFESDSKLDNRFFGFGTCMKKILPFCQINEIEFSRNSKNTLKLECVGGETRACRGFVDSGFPSGANMIQNFVGATFFVSIREDL